MIGPDFLHLAGCRNRTSAWLHISSRVSQPLNHLNPHWERREHDLASSISLIASLRMTAAPTSNSETPLWPCQIFCWSLYTVNTNKQHLTVGFWGVGECLIIWLQMGRSSSPTGPREAGLLAPPAPLSGGGGGGRGSWFNGQVRSCSCGPQLRLPGAASRIKAVTTLHLASL